MVLSELKVESEHMSSILFSLPGYYIKFNPKLVL